jgi:AmmeMemoRadiSam system protein A
MPGDYTELERQQLLGLARQAIAYGLAQHVSLRPEHADYSDHLLQHRACFVTLKSIPDKQLRGCIGTLEAYRPLVDDVAANAYAAAFQDPRFMPLKSDELEQLRIHISVLSPREAVSFTSEQDLLQQIRPGIDGLVLSEDYHRGTFLPSVWESLSDPQEFLMHLKLKAGLPADYWSDKIRVERYTTESFAEDPRPGMVQGS